MTPPVDAPAQRCTRDTECSGLTFCNPDGICVPLVCTPGRLVCNGPNRASVCDGRGATTSDVDCPGGCVLNNCMGMTAACASPRVLCGSSCVDAQTSAAHCGRCSNACPSGQMCAAGACVAPCVAPRAMCGGACADVLTSAAHCGRCDNACPSGQACAAGACVAVCAAPATACGTVCADLENSVSHCGRCNNACPGGQSCVGGACTVVCAAPQVNCGGVCTATQSSPAHCGRCNNACPGAQACVAGACVATCAAPRALCSGACTDLATSAAHCGRCANACASGQSCVAGACTLVCPAGQLNCGGACVDAQTSGAHCGRCANACAAGQACVAGACVTSTCAAPRMLCAGACTDAQSSASHCGRCGNACASDQTCFLGSCVAACGAPRGLCGSACVDLQASVAHCGRCNNPCAAGQACTGGACGAAPTGAPFRAVSLSTTGCRTLEQPAEAGDDRGGITVNASYVFYNADGRFARWSSADLTGYLASPSPRDGLVNDLATGAIYAMLSATDAEFAGSTASSPVGFAITQLGAVDATTGALTAGRVRLSTPVVVTHDAGFFAGHGFIVVHSGLATPLTPQRWYVITLPSGAVTTFAGNGNPPHHVCENGAWWGLAERIAGQYSVVHVRNNTSIVRTRLSDNVQAVLGTYTDLADVCSITALPASGRWYFHAEGSSEMAPAGVETTGYCPGAFAFTDP